MGNLFKMLAGPIANPFRIHHDERPPGKVLGKGYQMHWERKTLPGAGAGQYAFETLGLPPYPVYGRGNINVTNPLRETFPASYAFQAVGVVGNPPTSIVQGQFITQPLMDPSAAANMGVVTPGAINPGPNAILSPSPTLGP